MFFLNSWMMFYWGRFCLRKEGKYDMERMPINVTESQPPQPTPNLLLRLLPGWYTHKENLCFAAGRQIWAADLY